MGLIERKRLAIENGKFVLKPIEKSKDPWVMEQVQNITIAIHEKIEEEKSKKKYCGNCGLRINSTEQNYCEECGIAL